MKKKTKERLDRIEKRLQQLVEDVQELKAPMHGKESVKEKGAAARTTKTTRAKKVATKKLGKPRKAMATKKVVVAEKAEAAPGTATAKKTATKLAPKLAKKKEAAKAQRPTNAKPATQSVPKLAPKSKLKMTKPVMPKAKASVAPAAVVPEPKTATSVISEAGKGGEFPG